MIDSGAVLTHPLLEAPGVRHGFFTRRGGVSGGLYASLNIGRGSNDLPAHVEENRRRVAEHLGARAEALLTCHQIHSNIAHIAAAPWDGSNPQGDAVATAAPGLICAALAADCAPILLVDPETGIVGAAHAGWKGALGGIVEAVVAALESLGAVRERLHAVVGPCIGPQSYEVGPEFETRFLETDPGLAVFFAEAPAAQKRRFDLPGFVLRQLDRAGVGDAAWIGRDTLAEPDLFYSYRRTTLKSEPDYGRMVSAIVRVR